MAEREQAHRIQAETAVVKGELAADRRGQWLGFCVAFGSLFAAVGAVYLGAAWPVPVACVSVPVLGMVHAIVTGRRKREDE